MPWRGKMGRYFGAEGWGMEKRGGSLCWAIPARNRYVSALSPQMLAPSRQAHYAENVESTIREAGGPNRTTEVQVSWPLWTKLGLHAYLSRVIWYLIARLTTVPFNTGALANGTAPRLSRHSAWLQSPIQSVGARGIIRLDELR